MKTLVRKVRWWLYKRHENIARKVWGSDHAVAKKNYYIHSFSTTGMPKRFNSRRIVAADTVHSDRRLAFSSGVSALFTEQFS